MKNCDKCGNEIIDTDIACPICDVGPVAEPGAEPGAKPETELPTNRAEPETELPPEFTEDKAQDTANRNDVVQLAGRALRGDDSVWGEIYEKTQRYVYYMALKFLRSEQDAQDVTQEVFIQAIRSIGQLYTADSFFGWLRSIIFSKCKDLIKKKKPVLLEEDEDGGSPLDDMPEISENFIPDMALDSAETRRMILELVDALPYQQRQAVMFYYYDEMTVGQIAAVMGCPEGTVKSRLNYARQQIKKGVEEHEKKGVKLYGSAALPILSILLREQAKTLLIPQTVAGGLGSILGTAAGSAASSATGGAAGAAATTATAEATAGGTGSAAGAAGGTTAGGAASGAAGAAEAGATATTAATTATTATTAGAASTAGTTAASAAAASTAASAVTTATTTAATAATATGAALATKIIIGIVTAAVLIGGGVVLLTNDSDTADSNKSPPPSITAPAETDTGGSANTGAPGTSPSGSPNDGTGSVTPEEDSFYDTLSEGQKQMLSRLVAAMRASDYDSAHNIQKSAEFRSLCQAIPDWGGFWYYPDDETIVLVFLGLTEPDTSYNIMLYAGINGYGRLWHGKFGGGHYHDFSLSETDYSGGKANGPFTCYYYHYTEDGGIEFSMNRGNLRNGAAYGSVYNVIDGVAYDVEYEPEWFNWWPDWPD